MNGFRIEEKNAVYVLPLVARLASRHSFGKEIMMPSSWLEAGGIIEQEDEKERGGARYGGA